MDTLTSRSAATVHALPSPDQAAFRAAMSSFTTGVTVVTTCSDGRLHATTVNSFTSVSLEPMLVLVCLGTAGRTLGAITSSGVFSVDVLAADQVKLSLQFADRRRQLSGAGFGDSVEDFDRHGCPRFADSLTSFCCRVSVVHPAGDHAIVVGEVVGIRTRETTEEPLVFHRGRYRSLSEDLDAAVSWPTSGRTSRAS